MKNMKHEQTPEDMDEEQSAQERDNLQLDLLSSLGQALIKKAERAVRDRTSIEERMIEDLQQVHGILPETVRQEQAGAATKVGSKVVFNLTRPKRNAAAARISDMLFPIDERNWGIKPTPVPELVDAQKSDGTIVDPQDGAEVAVADLAEAELVEARKRAEAMEKEIDDQLTECDYRGTARDVLFEAATFGTGIIKGPVVTAKTRKKWSIDDGSGAGVLEIENDIRPTAEHVSVWNFFPEMGSGTNRIEDACHVFERRHATPKQLRQMAKAPGFIKEAVKEALQSDPKEHRITDTVLDELKSIAGVDTAITDNRLEIWEYHGPISREEVEAAFDQANKSAKDEDDHDSIDDDDQRDEFDCVAVIVNGRVIRVTINPLDTEEFPYSVFPWEPSESTVFGYGVPFMMRHQQRVVNGAWRMMMDNAGLSTGPQIVIKRGSVTPANGRWEIEPRKVWYLEDTQHGDTRDTVGSVFATHSIDSHQPELANILNLARQMIDEETSMPLIAQGEQAGHVTQTAKGMSMLMNNGNVVLRRGVKMWDDRITRPMITRFYDYNMQFSAKREIKGDYEIDARGTSAMLVRETQSQQLQILMQLAQGPQFAGLTKFDELYRKVVESMELSPDSIIKTKEEIEEEQAKAAEQHGQQMDEAQMKLQIEQSRAQASVQVAQIRAEADLQIAQMRVGSDHQYAVARLALEREMKLVDVEEKLGIDLRKLESNEKVAAVKAMNQQAEMDLKREMGSGI